jgi:putative transcriptional regulator
MRPNHHPLPETLISYVSGTLPNAVSCVVACHVTMCRDCADDVRRIEILGGVLLSNLRAEPAGNALAERAVARWAAQEWHAPRPDREVEIGRPLLPLLLARYLGRSGKEVSWEAVVTGVQQYWIKLPAGAGRMNLLRLMPGQDLREHVPRAGTELILVLQGVFSGRAGDYVRGDVIEWAEDMATELRASGDTECVCLVAGDASSAERAKPSREPQGLLGSPRPLEKRLRGGWSTTLPLAASLAMIVGLGLGWLLGGSGAAGDVVNDLVRIDNKRLLARGPLQTALDRLPSGGQIAASSAEGNEFQLGVTMTFQDQAGEYCRQYRVTVASSERYEGVACRAGDHWAVQIQALLPTSPSAANETILAGAGPKSAMDAAVESLIVGDPLVGAEEADLLTKNWKK